MRILSLFLSFLTLGCGAEYSRPTKSTTITPQAGTYSSDLCPIGMSYIMTVGGTGVCTAPAAACTGLCSSQPTTACPAGIPAGTVCTIPLTQTTTTVPVYGSTPVYGANASVPSSYTFLDTPNANLCLDAFIRNGTPVPDTAVAKTMTINSRNSNTLLTDSPTTPAPVVTIITANQCGSSVMLQLLNPQGFYCIVGINSCRSSVTIQKRCTAQVASIEPTTINNSSAPAQGFHLFWKWFTPPQPTPSDGAFNGSYNQSGSSIKEVPCIP